jgi:tRNA uridine 5-carboxymethylaminomethyl modification enzyme
LRRTDTDWETLAAMYPPLNDWAGRADAVEQVVLECKYAGYIGRQADQVERFRKMEDRPIPAGFDYAAVTQLRFEAREKLARIRPANIGQAGRVSGITPADLAVLLLCLD